ncbi:MAG: hypothetical protein IIC78_01640, partial [Chloroflexi bacterium]|nr:hypothetical protein [Chloroflexota bacterium]
MFENERLEGILSRTQLYSAYLDFQNETAWPDEGKQDQKKTSHEFLIKISYEFAVEGELQRFQDVETGYSKTKLSGKAGDNDLELPQGENPLTKNGMIISEWEWALQQIP